MSGNWSPARNAEVEARELSLAYGRRTVLEKVSFSWAVGQGAAGLAGPNGSGKSTFLKACVGLLSPRSGELRLLGVPVASRGFRASLRQIGWVPQHRSPGTLRLTVRELVGLGRSAQRGLFRPMTSIDREAVEQAIQTAGLVDLARRPVQELSGGQWQRASMARALAAQPRLLLLDEPTTHLDREGRRSVLDLLEVVAAEPQRGLMVVSHDEAVLALCRRFFAFDGGGVREADRTELDLS